MNTSRRSYAGAVLGVLLLATPVRAEVAAETDAFGTYVRTVIYASASVRNPRIWTATRLRHGYTPLNPRGDAAGDLFPVVAEDPARGRWPWVVWSHFNDEDFDLVWSRWEGDRWSPIAPVEIGETPSDAVDPAIAIGDEGRPHLVWLSRADGPAEVNLSIFLASRWMEPFRVSDPGEDAMNPTILLRADGLIEVGYDTVGAHVVKLVAFARPSTITDDTTPFGSVGVTPNQPPGKK
jgi:hypothetical protein